jgi:hypothetical protein
MLMLGGCVTSGGSLTAVSLPSPATAGDLMRKVPVPAVHAGDDARLKLAETTAALKKANGRIQGSCEWYDGQRRHYDTAAKSFQCDRPPVN